MRIQPNSAAVLAVAGLLLLNGCTPNSSTANVASGWQDMPPQNADLVFLGDKLDMELKSMRYLAKLENHREFETARWTGPGGRYPRLYLRLESLYPGYYFPKDLTPARNIIKNNRSFKDHGVEFGVKGVVVNALGQASYETFRSGNLYCFVLQQGFGEAWSGDNKILSGYYCDSSPIGTSPDRIQLILQNVGVKGEGVPGG